MTIINNKTDGHYTVNLPEKNKNAETKAMGRSCFINKCSKMSQPRENSVLVRGWVKINMQFIFLLVCFPVRKSTLSKL